MNKITGYTGLYGIVADPIKHSFSPMMHNTSFQVLGMDDVYLAFEVKEEHLKTFIESAKVLPIKGFNVSMPYKVKIMDYLDEVTPEAKLCKAVNTVKNNNGKLIGHISDGKGFMLACEEKNWHVKDQKIVIIGAGGAAQAIIVALDQYQVREIIVYNRSNKPYIHELSKQLKTKITLKIFDEEQLKEDDFRKEYEKIQPEMDVIRALVDARISQNLTQKQLAERTGINQADISKLENGTRNPSLNLLKRLAEGMDMVLKIEFVPKQKV